MRLIDADSLINAMSGWDQQDLYLPIHFKQLIDEEETITIVRCKDCKHWVWPNTCGDEVITRYENDFCSRGERKEDEQSNISY